MKPDELRSKNADDLKNIQKELSEELFKLKIQKSTGQLEKTHRMKELRVGIARVMTEINVRDR